jgi:hypothetical protein
MGKKRKYIRKWHDWRNKFFRQLWLSHAHCKNLRCIKDETGRIRKSDILAVIVLRNEAHRIAYFLRYYRKLGVDHFLFIDNGSTDGLKEILSHESDCSVWYTEDSYKASKFGIYWANHVLRQYGVGHWCLMLDPDEFLVYPYMDHRSLRELTEFLDQEGKESFFTVMLDMYGRGTVAEATCLSGQDPLEVCSWFDQTGYYQEYQPDNWDWWIRGGVRRRVFCKDKPWEAPALNKTVLVKWRYHFSFTSSAHVLWPRRLNRIHFKHGLAPTGCLLHFKFLSVFKEKVEEEMQRKEHYSNSLEYSRYQNELSKGLSLWHQGSVQFKGWQQCVNLGLMNLGRWF